MPGVSGCAGNNPLGTGNFFLLFPVFDSPDVLCMGGDTPGFSIDQAMLPEDVHWKFIHIGGGELLDELKTRAGSLGLSAQIDWLGALPQTEVLAHYRAADLFVLPSHISANGDRDGLPNVLMEAQSQRLACLSTNISGIPELIEHAKTGWLVPQKNTAELKDALLKLIYEPELRQTLAEAGLLRVREHFSLHRGIDQLVEKLSLTAKPEIRR